jgi:uncharacterized protein (TIGR02265 family)
LYVVNVARSYNEASLRACFAHSDLEWRLAQIPTTAMCRGAFFNMLDDRAGSLSPTTQAEYRHFFRVTRFVPFRMYPVSDYLTRMAIVCQVHWGAEEVYEAMRTIQASAFDAWARTLLGRAALAVIDPSLEGVLRMIERAYASRTLNTHADFNVISATNEEVVTRFKNEYLPIEHAMVGALEAVLVLCRVRGTVVAELDGPFDGVVRIRLRE